MTVTWHLHPGQVVIDAKTHILQVRELEASEVAKIQGKKLRAQQPRPGKTARSTRPQTSCFTTMTRIGMVLG